jgi:hypothetical protein
VGGGVVGRGRPPGGARPGRPAGRTVALAALVVVAHVLMFALMLGRHPYVYDCLDHRHWYYPLPALAVLLYAATLALEAGMARLQPGGRRLVQVVLAGLVLANLLSLPHYRQVMIEGPWFSTVHAKSERLKAALRADRDDPGLDSGYRTFLAHAREASADER